MSRKLQQFYIMKFNSDRLKNSNYKITIKINEARRNGEIVSQGDNAVLRAIRKIKDQPFSVEELDNLKAQKKKLARSFNDKENKKKIFEIENNIDNMLFVPEIIAVKVNDNRHYKKMISNGVHINGKEFIRLLCGAGNSRRNTVLFIDKEYFDRVDEILNNGRDRNVEMVPAKYNAYYGLYNSGGWSVSTPKMLVVKDAEIEKITKLDFVVEGTQDRIEEKEVNAKFNLFDGQGIISPRLAERWATELQLDYLPSNFIIRASFIKGMCVTFDFHRFAHEVAHNYLLQDVWGNIVDINDVDIIISQSQFKLWDAYKSLADYNENCEKNGLEWSVSRYSPKQDKTSVRSNYQFLQVLNLDDNQIKSLCKKTVDFFDYAILDRYEYALLYLLGSYVQEEIDDEWLDGIQDIIVKAMIYNPELLNDPYIKQHIIKTLNKKIKESYLGSLIMDGNYSVMISDPYAQCESIFGLPINGLLNNNEHYSNYWNKLYTEKIVACRAPLTWRSEVNILNLKVSNKLEDWYSYIYSGIIYNVHGIDTMLHADSDVDGDLVMTTNSQEFIDGAYGGIPVSYEKKIASKSIIFNTMLWESDVRSFNSKVGFITNSSTAMYALLPLFEAGSTEYNEIIQRLKLCRFHQGNEIDKAKGIQTKPFPKEWTNWQKKYPDMSEEEIAQIDFENKLCINRRPYFMRYLYRTYDRKYKKYLEAYEMVCQTRLGYGIKEVLSNPLPNIEECVIIDSYHKFNPLLDTPSVMNKICHYMEDQIKEIRLGIKGTSFDALILFDKNVPIDENKLSTMNKLWDEWKAVKRKKPEDGVEVEGITHIAKEFHLRAEKISSDGRELANLAAHICYIDNPKAPKDFLWLVFGEELLENIKSNRLKDILIPVFDPNGSIEYMGKNYEMIVYEGEL